MTNLSVNAQMIRSLHKGRLRFNYLSFLIVMLFYVCTAHAGTKDTDRHFNDRVNAGMFYFHPSLYLNRNKNHIIVIAHVKYATPWRGADGKPMSGTCSILKQYAGPSIYTYLNCYFPFDKHPFYYSLHQYAGFDADMASEFSFFGSIPAPVSGSLQEVPKIEVLLTPYLEKVFTACEMARAVEIDDKYMSNWEALRMNGSVTNYDALLTEGGVVRRVQVLQDDPILAYLQFQLFMQEGLITKPETFNEILALFPERDMKRSFEQFASYYGSKEIRDSLFDTLLKEIAEPNTFSLRPDDVRILINGPNNWDSSQKSSLNSSLMALSSH